MRRAIAHIISSTSSPVYSIMEFDALIQDGVDHIRVLAHYFDRFFYLDMLSWVFLADIRHELLISQFGCFQHPRITARRRWRASSGVGMLFSGDSVRRSSAGTCGNASTSLSAA